MALLQTTNIKKFGEIADAYHRIMHISLLNGASVYEVDIAIYKSEALRTANISNVIEIENVKIPAPVENTNIIKYAYEQLKLLPIYSSAKDC